jgi:hypothetical protein
MNRTRLIFYLFLGVYLAAITAALALNIAGERFIMQLFVASAVFSLGVVMLDFLGILGGQHDGAAGGDTAGHIAADASGHDFGGHDGGGAPDGAPHAAGEANGHADDGGAHNAQPHATGGQHNAAPILSALTYLRLFVYFCLGFGPAGLISRLAGRSVFLSLGVAALVGLIAHSSASNAAISIRNWAGRTWWGSGPRSSSRWIITRWARCEFGSARW